jgi:hypothetical protein
MGSRVLGAPTDGTPRSRAEVPAKLATSARDEGDSPTARRSACASCVRPRSACDSSGYGCGRSRPSGSSSDRSCGRSAVSRRGRRRGGRARACSRCARARAASRRSASHGGPRSRRPRRSRPRDREGEVRAAVASEVETEHAVDGAGSTRTGLPPSSFMRRFATATKRFAAARLQAGFAAWAGAVVKAPSAAARASSFVGPA